MTEIEKLYKEYYKVLNKQVFNEKNLDYKQLQKHIDFLIQLDVIENSSISIFDLNKKEHIFISQNYSKMLGYNIEEAEKQGNSYFNAKVHPDDFLINLKNGIKLLDFSFQIPVAERKNYKLVLDYRVKNARDEYIRIIEQQQTLELDKTGNIWVALSIVDISPSQDLTAGPKSRIFNFKTGEFISNQEFSDTQHHKNILSKREHEVLKLVKNGLPSKEIADKLSISVHTVNTHRQRILEKLNVSNSHEAIQYVSELGLLD